MFFSPEEKELTEEYFEQGYVIKPVEDLESLEWVRSALVDASKSYLDKKGGESPSAWLNEIHQEIQISDLNDFRLKMISDINAHEQFRQRYFQLSKRNLEVLVGNELAMQTRVNLSIQIPNDESSLLDVHADTWSGDSPYEVVVWIPLVDCYRSKSMYLLPPDASEKLTEKFPCEAYSNSEELFKAIQSDVIWLNVPYGSVLLFDQGLPHGNRVNKETETRWSMNCRFKSVFTPYGDKKIGEFFEPITLRAASRKGMSYQYPRLA